MSNKHKNIIVMKFGGAALENALSIKKISSIVYWAKQKYNTIIVVSAIKQITDKLHEIVSQIKLSNTSVALKEINSIYEQHIIILRMIDASVQSLDTEQKLKNLKDLLTLFIKKVSPGVLTNAQQDYIISFGERMSVHIVSHSLRVVHKLHTLALDTTSLLTTTKDFGNATPILDESVESMKHILFECLKNRIIPVITGYVGHAKDGCITTLGRGGSDLTATLIASLIHANRVVLWKDVVGLFDKDPKIYPEAQIFKAVTYDTAIKLSKAGAKILHPDAIDPAKRVGIPVYIKSFLFPKSQGTIISKSI